LRFECQQEDSWALGLRAISASNPKCMLAGLGAGCMSHTEAWKRHTRTLSALLSKPKKLGAVHLRQTKQDTCPGTRLGACRMEIGSKALPSWCHICNTTTEALRLLARALCGRHRKKQKKAPKATGWCERKLRRSIGRSFSATQLRLEEASHAAANKKKHESWLAD
jgi:hypothetical protein